MPLRQPCTTEQRITRECHDAPYTKTPQMIDGTAGEDRRYQADELGRKAAVVFFGIFGQKKYANTNPTGNGNRGTPPRWTTNCREGRARIPPASRRSRRYLG